ncbi:type III PLP-dependent enzyme [Streptomyces zingiberis]|uniref:Type III PLP-dependent enzyme n=1 Tax=Streptomyces zingiberis TaxID=2053010 RepID=A0ABX1BXA2_9ACTN|nr:type III PLP-dependent enzyme [Streptomyces zingiberis]NJQ01091.1 type III PLP-dependent enzyme [Streptomyces zingiberis]
MTEPSTESGVPTSTRRHLTQIIQSVGTPAYVYDLGVVRSSFAALREDLPAASELFYSLKANPHPLVVAQLADLGARAEVSSTGELSVALAAGCPAHGVLYTGPGKTMAELEDALHRGVRLFSVESVTDRQRLAEACSRTGSTADYLIRVNSPRGSTGGSLRMTGRPSAFGVDHNDSQALDRLLRPLGAVRPVGMHTFCATNIADPVALAAEFEQSVRTIAAIAGPAGFTPQVLDLGGGFPAPFARPGSLPRHPQLRAAIDAALDTAFPDQRRNGTRVLFESGRALTATAGTLLTTVLDVKLSGDRVFAVLDAGVNVLGGMSGLGRLRSPSVVPIPLGEGTPASELSPAGPVTLVGPLCTPLDVLAPAVEGLSLSPGQTLAIPNTGAYGPTASLLGFLSRTPPAEVVVDGDRIVAAGRLGLHTQEVVLRG